MAEGRNVADSEDLIRQILVKLPVKSLQRCKCVCKSWFHLIENPNFIYRHLDYHKNNVTLLTLENHYFKKKRLGVMSLFFYGSSSIISPYLVMNCCSDDKDVFVTRQCNGLICVGNSKNSFLLCNPSLMQSKLLPPYPFPTTIDFIGLGFDTATNDHKFVVKFSVVKCSVKDNTLKYYKREQKVLIRSLIRDCWRETDTGINFELSGYSYAGIPFNGMLHWLVLLSAQKILCLDMKTEVFSLMELPCTGENKCIFLGVLDECLALLAYKYPNDSSTVHFIDVWVMHKYGVEESWTKQLSVGPVIGFVAPMFFWKNEALIVKNLQGQLASVSLDTGETNDLDIRRDKVTVYQESLISVNFSLRLPLGLPFEHQMKLVGPGPASSSSSHVHNHSLVKEITTRTYNISIAPGPVFVGLVIVTSKASIPT